MTSKKIISVILAIWIAAAAAGCKGNTPQTDPTLPPAQPSVPQSAESGPTDHAPAEFAPDFTVYDRDGHPVKLSELRGKPVVLNFWSSKCPPCRSEMPDFQTAYETFGGEVHFVMVNLTDGMWDTVDSAAAFADGNGYTFPIYFDTDGDAAAVYQISSIPTTFFIDASGSLVVYSVGMLNMERLLVGIGRIL